MFIKSLTSEVAIWPAPRYDIDAGAPLTPTSRDGYIDGAAMSAAERKRIYAFRYNVYAEQMARPNVDDADHQSKLLHDTLDPTAYHFTVERHGLVVGAMRGNLFGDLPQAHPYRHAARADYDLDSFLACSPDGVAFTSRLIIDPAHRNGPVLQRLLAMSYAAGLDKQVDFNFFHCSPSLVDFYERLGYRRFTNSLVDPAFGYRVPMVLVMRDLAHLKSVGSPLLRILRRETNAEAPHPSVAWFNRHHRAVVAEARARRDRNSPIWRGFHAALGHAAATAPILHGLSGEDIRLLTREGSVLHCRHGETVVKQSAYGSSMFLLISGSARTSGNELTECRPGDVFGEVALITETPRIVNVTMTADSEVFVLTRRHLDRLRKTRPELAAKILYNISKILARRLVAAKHST